MLDDSLTDTDGIPSPKIIYRNSDNTEKLIAFHLDRQREAMEAAGAKSISTTTLMRDCGWHLMGTCRMGNDPETSVLDQWGTRHDVPNLHAGRQHLRHLVRVQPHRHDLCHRALRSVMHMIETRADQRVAS